MNSRTMTGAHIFTTRAFTQYDVCLYTQNNNFCGEPKDRQYRFVNGSRRCSNATPRPRQGGCKDAASLQVDPRFWDGAMVVNRMGLPRRNCAQPNPSWFTFSPPHHIWVLKLLCFASLLLFCFRPRLPVLLSWLSRTFNIDSDSCSK